MCGHDLLLSRLIVLVTAYYRGLLSGFDVAHILTSTQDIEGMCGKLHSIFDYVAPVGQMPFLDHLLQKNPVVLLLDKLGVGGFGFPVAIFAKKRVLEKTQNASTELSAKRPDLLTMFLKAQKDRPDFMTDQRVLTMAVSMSFAGSDTTSISLGAVLYYLLKNPRCYQKLIEEIETAVHEGRIQSRPNGSVSWTESQQLPYLDACVNESFRIHSAAGLPLERVTPQQGMEIDGRFVPGGTIVGVSAWVLHRNAGVFDPQRRYDVDSWIPERWLESSKEEVKEMRANMLQFGAGSRTVSIYSNSPPEYII